jgi:uroporphyrinogen decarboxylase
LSGQVEAGADVLQIFDSWAGSLADDEFDRWVIKPTAKIVKALKAKYPHVPILGFPRGAASALKTFVTGTGVDGVSCDTSCPLPVMQDVAASGTVAQGNLDPLLLVAGGTALDHRAGAIIAAMKGKPFIFNLGHGIVPETPPEHVAQLVARVRRKA